MAAEEEESMGIPEWVVTFGDMMSLLLTFFIMLVSLSEMKEEEKYPYMKGERDHHIRNMALLKGRPIQRK